MDSNFQFPDIVEGSFFGRSQRGSAAGPKVCRLAAGGNGIRTLGPAESSTGARLFTLDHEELIGAGLGAPDLALAAGELPHVGVAIG